ncbi:hypothetical protein CMU19_13785 [Elizabethkingia anophelis]|nr:hypothetical protein [Elizabethkingia anophelis]
MSCDNDYSYVLKDPNASKNGYIINMEDHNTKLTIATLSGNIKFYFLKKKVNFIVQILLSLKIVWKVELHYLPLKNINCLVVITLSVTA